MVVIVDEFDNFRDYGFSVGVNINVLGVIGLIGLQFDIDVMFYNGFFIVMFVFGNVFIYQM